MALLDLVRTRSRTAGQCQYLHALNGKLLCAFYRALEHEPQMTVAGLFVAAGIPPSYLESLRQRYPETFRLIFQYQKAKNNWNEGRKTDGSLPKAGNVWIPCRPKSFLLRLLPMRQLEAV